MNYQGWLLLGIIFFIIELLTPSIFLFSCFGLACIIIYGLHFIIDTGTSVQWILFIILSVIFIVISRPFAKKITNKKTGKNIFIDSIVGKNVIIEDMDPQTKNVFAKIEGEKWLLKSEDGSLLKTGDSVLILKIEGTKLIVKKN